MILTDAVADRLHALQTESLRRFAGAFATLRPDAFGGPVGTGYALDAGEGSPLTQCAGFAHRAPGDPAAIERFFAPHTANWEVTITPFTDAGTARALLAAGYRFQAFEGVLAQTVGDGVPEVRHEVVEVADDLEPWLEANVRAWDADEGETVEAGELARAAALAVTRRYLALVDGVPAAVATMIECGDAVLLMGGATRVPYRGRGLQAALLARRLRDAGRGRLAVVGAVPGSTSHRNAQRAGFVPVCSTVTLMRR